MSALTNDEFAARVMELAGPAGSFKPNAYYDSDGDCIEFLAKPDNFYAERVDDLVTVYLSEATGEVIGSLLKGVTPLCNELLVRLPGFKVEIQQGKVMLVHIFQARLWAFEVDPSELATLAYKKIIEVADKTRVEVDLKKAA